MARLEQGGQADGQEAAEEPWAMSNCRNGREPGGSERGKILSTTLARQLVGQNISGYVVEELMALGSHSVVYLLGAPRGDLSPPAMTRVLKVYQHEGAEPMASREFAALEEIVAAPRAISQAEVVLPSLGTRPALVMSQLGGRRLDDQLGGIVGRASLVANVWLALAKAIASVHAAGWVHGDIALRNLFVELEPCQGGPPEAWVLDFGVSHLRESHLRESHLRETSGGEGLSGGESNEGQRRVVGTPRTMAPEVASGDLAGCESDVYSLGCIAYELIVGQPVFDGATSLEICWKQANSEIPPVPPELLRRAGVREVEGRLLQSMLARDPGCRPMIDDVVTQLAALCNQRSMEQK